MVDSPSVFLSEVSGDSGRLSREGKRADSAVNTEEDEDEVEGFETESEAEGEECLPALSRDCFEGNFPFDEDFSFDFADDGGGKKESEDEEFPLSLPDAFPSSRGGDLTEPSASRRSVIRSGFLGLSS